MLTIEQLYTFLADNENRCFNANFQRQTHKAWLSISNTNEERALTVLFECAHTQSRPKLDRLLRFWKLLRNSPERLESFHAFGRGLGASERAMTTAPYREVYSRLKAIDGWGEKTAALFIRHLIAIRADNTIRDLHFWDLPPLHREDTVYLPVDRVIRECFRRLGVRGRSFTAINTLLRDHPYGNAEILVWDDLWFWGFITQRITATNNDPQIAWNEGKYWGRRWTDKNPETISEIKRKAKQFSRLFRP
jgi:hypothetical protein